MYKVFKNHGSSLIEVIVAMAIFSLVSSSLAGVILGNFNILARGGELVRSVVIIDSQMEKVIAVKDRAWNELVFAMSSIEEVDDKWEFTGEGTEVFEAGYSRSISYFDIYRSDVGEIVAEGATDSYLDIYSKRVLANVGWEVMGSQQKTITRDVLLTAWKTNFWIQDDFSGGSEQEEWSDEAMFYASSSIEIVNNKIQLEKNATTTYETDGYLISSAYKIDSSRNFIGIEWEVDLPDDTAVKIQIKTAPDNSGSPGTWSTTWAGPDGDEDGDESDYFEIKTGELINMVHNGDVWLKYKVFLDTSDDEETPVVKSVEIGF